MRTTGALRLRKTLFGMTIHTKTFKVTGELVAKLARLESHGMLCCECKPCGEIFFVSSNLGALRCPHCGVKTIKIWGGSDIAFTPETPPGGD